MKSHCSELFTSDAITPALLNGWIAVDFEMNATPKCKPERIFFIEVLFGVIVRFRNLIIT